ncbi:MAG: phage holin family protein [Rhodothermaceae bacterium]|nr:phage holin family protein [Rhodothermaceae bacterium]MXW32132.1 phage holin family protein [Rhodothermaceae bacterium]MYC03126.1 phage holin family protein [Rhodothermaceae bacterium]MYE61934.1 phage holin family protein [Rhodothermaceae bacterium]MYI16875.1 phage holin family protein [Rhodothermaceae bacterium]
MWKTSKSDRITLHSKELIKNLQAWLDLRVQLAGWQYWDTILQNRKTIYAVIAAGFLLAVSVIFLLIAAALGVGFLLGHIIWGFVSVGVIMGVGAWCLSRLTVRLMNPEIENIDRTITETNGQNGSEKETDE